MYHSLSFCSGESDTVASVYCTYNEGSDDCRICNVVCIVYFVKAHVLVTVDVSGVVETCVWDKEAHWETGNGSPITYCYCKEL